MSVSTFDGVEKGAKECYAQRDLKGVARSLTDIVPLLRALDGNMALTPFSACIPKPPEGGAPQWLREMCNWFGVDIRPPSGESSGIYKSSFDIAISHHLSVPEPLWHADISSDQARDAVQNALCSSTREGFNPRVIDSHDGVSLNAFSIGDSSHVPIVIVPAPGMPIELCRDWMESLSSDYQVVSWESRWLFGCSLDPHDQAYDVEAQTGDLFAVMDALSVSKAHLIGLCGGAVISLMAAATCPERFSTVSVWHGDFAGLSVSSQTEHQLNLIELMSMAGEDRPTTQGLQALFRRPSVLDGVPIAIAHWALYPYANPELLYRYSLLNGRIMGANLKDALGAIRQPALVVTSRDDTTAHPNGSRIVAESIADSHLVIRSSGDHQTLFTDGADMIRSARLFIEKYES